MVMWHAGVSGFPIKRLCHNSLFCHFDPFLSFRVGGGQEEPKMALVAPLALERGHSYPLPPFILMGGFIPSC
jgi:hypothetical protein